MTSLRFPRSPFRLVVFDLGFKWLVRMKKIETEFEPGLPGCHVLPLDHGIPLCVLNFKLLSNLVNIASKQCGQLGQVPPALACYNSTGWNTYHLLAPLTWLALKDLLNATWKVKCHKEVSHLTKYLVGHLKVDYVKRPRCHVLITLFYFQWWMKV